MEKFSSRLSLSKRKRSERKQTPVHVHQNDDSTKKICPADASSISSPPTQPSIDYAEHEQITPGGHIEEPIFIEILSSDDEESCQEISKAACNRPQQEASLPDDASFNKPAATAEAAAGIEESKGLSYKTSAYVQNLAEICHDILHDARWRTSSKRLFQWELGDDLSALHSLSRLFILPSQEREESIDIGTGIVIGEGDELYARCMHLYSRLFHRKGPWFHIADIFVRYYHRDYIRRQSYEHDGDESADNPISWSILEQGLNDCIYDLHRLYQMGILRTFTTEQECGHIVGNSDSKLFTEKDKLKVLHKLGGKGSKGTTKNRSRSVQNAILNQMKSQRTIMFHKKETALLPVRNHANDVLLDVFAAKLNAMVASSGGKESKSIQDVKRLLKRIWKSISAHDVPLFTCFRLRERPLLTLRRACRIYLCAGDGPGSMRWSGSNAWLTVIEGEDNFTDQRIEDRSLLKGICSLPEPPTTSLWHQVVFHGLKFRMGMSFFSLTDNYVRMPASLISPEDRDANSHASFAEVFHDPITFKTWERTVELRCIVDYLSEWNRLILYADRKIIAASKKSEDVAIDIKSRLNPCICETFDFLSVEGRSELSRQFAVFCANDEVTYLKTADALNERIEGVICLLHHRSSSDENSPQSEEDGDSFATDAERMICSIGIICQQVLLYRFETLPMDEAKSFISRPWLRHLQPESVLAYILWDCVEILEKRGYHKIASQMLETILFGCVIMEPKWQYEDYSRHMENNTTLSHFSQVLLSRRVRGKAFERLLIDKKHAIKKDSPKSKNKVKTPCDVDAFTADCLPTIASTGSIPFSFIRKFTRRIKRSLTQTLDDAWSIEMLELGIRLVDNDTGAQSSITEKEWSPTVDVSVANAIRHDSDNGAGKRCAFISSEENDGIEHTRSLNVEELAIEEYAAGRLPVDDDDKVHIIYKGGWKGWHCEGIHVRVLFRILCTRVLLADDGQQTGDVIESMLLQEQCTIFLHPYQTAPLDLHVAHGGLRAKNNAPNSTVIRSFYERRRNRIEEFLKKLEGMKSQELCDFVYKSVVERKEKMQQLGKKLRHDPILCNDLKEVRTLSMLAAGFGGKLLASMFRLLAFDYRHYGAGLPDLLLVRAFCQDTKSTNGTAGTCRPLDLSQWVGEVFQHSPASNSSILDDRDDEFIGGSINDRQALASSNQRRKNDKAIELQEYCPERLLLSHDGLPVTVDCMFVEVKSHNDKLDDRQEDWLNILDRFGNARLCKFTSSKKKPSNQCYQPE